MGEDTGSVEHIHPFRLLERGSLLYSSVTGKNKLPEKDESPCQHLGGQIPRGIGSRRKDLALLEGR